jgi:hypothetical protein
MSLSMSLLHPRQFEKDKIERTLNKNGIKQYFVKWGGYDEIFNPWVNGTDIKKI